MLPSTGYFKGISCPFYESGLCERPYCHFRHARKEPAADSGVILQQLVSEAVKKVLSRTDPCALETPSPTASAAPAPSVAPAPSLVPGKLTYNPTPIAELNKISNLTDDGSPSTEERPRRHIPVPYTPHRPTTAPVQNIDIDDNDASKPFIYNPPENVTYAPGSGEAKKPDPYMPQGSTVSNGKYLPGSETELQAYTPSDTKSSSNKLNYVPTGLTEKPEKKKKIIEYEPTRASVNAGMSRYRKSKDESKKDIVNEVISSGVKYRPTPLSKVPCFSSDEEEPNVKKRKVSEEGTDLNGLDDLDTEFEMLGQILVEEKSENLTDHKSDCHKENKKSHSKKEKDKDSEKLQESKKKTSSREEKKSSRDKDKRDIDKVKTSSTSKSKSSTTDSLKSSHKDKDREKHRAKSKESDNKKKEHHSSSKESSSKSSVKSSEKSTKTSASSKYSNRSKESSKDKKDKHERRKSEKNSRKENRSSRHTKSSSKNKPSNHANNDSDDLLSDNNNVDEQIEEISDTDEETIAMECMKIFEEYVPEIKQPQPGETETRVDVGQADEEYVPTKKRISHTTDKTVKVITRPPPKPDHKVNAAQAMAQRLAKVREFHALKYISTSSVTPEIPPLQKIEPLGNITPSHSKVRIAHVPNVSLLLNAKKPTSTKTLTDNMQASTSTTIMHTVKKGSTRMAHVPNEKFADRPGVLEPLASKIPANLRSTFLNMMIDECLKIYIIPTDAYARAQQEELITSKKCTTVAIYKNSAVLAVSRLRKELQECGGVKKNSYENDPNKISHSQVLLGKLAQSSWSIERNKKAINDFSNEFKGLAFYKNIISWVLDEEQLQQNGFPRPHPDGEKGRAKIHVENHKQIPPKGRLRTCCRCKREYMVDKRGLPASKEDCIYHPNRKYRHRGETRYQCCNQDGNSEGCAMATSHVFEYVDYDNLRGYVKTMPKEVADPENYDFGVYALDCEMCYTTQGLDLTRVTVINSECKTVYETLTKPLHPIVDYNTRYSGITEEQMSEVTTTLLEVQATLLSMFNSRTILIGHSLESDFKALKLIHDTVIDTSVLFPHKMGPPYKRALRNLSSEHLKKIIQNSTEGHDSAEDATVCMELVHFKLKEELKLR